MSQLFEDGFRDGANDHAPPAPSISSLEYWTYLGALAFLFAVFLTPHAANGLTLRQRQDAGAFGARRSSGEPMGVHKARALEPGRGREADAPWQIPWRGWKDILRRSYRQIGENRLLAVAAGVVFYGLLALFPALTAAVSLYGLFAKAVTINDHLTLASGILPSGALDIVREQVTRVVAKGDVKLGLGFLFGLAIALWSANAGMKAMLDALNVVYEEKERRGFLRLNLISLAFTLAAIASLLLALASVIVVPLLLQRIGLASVTALLLQFGRWPLLLLIVVAGLALIYRFGPSRREPRWQWLSIGSIVAAMAWLAASVLLSWYLGSFAHYDVTYGSLGAAIGTMMWMWVSTIVILLGAQLNSEIEHQTARDSTVGRNKPLGTRGAAMADTVGASA